jgi:predicted RNase H-like nuclease (RuvC/YqgF family)
MKALGEMKAARAIPQLERAARAEPSEDLREEARRALRRIRQEEKKGTRVEELAAEIERLREELRHREGTASTRLEELAAEIERLRRELHASAPGGSSEAADRLPSPETEPGD